MEYGLITKSTYGVISEIDRFSKLGFDYAEISMEEPYATPYMLRRDAKSILAALKRRGMFSIGHTAYWTDFGTMHKHVREGWIKEAMEMVLAARDLRMEYLNFHFYPGNGFTSKIPKGRKMFLENFTGAMEKLSAFAGKNNVTIMLENLGPRDSAAYLMEDFRHVLESVPRLMVHLDVAHAYIEGGNRKIEKYISAFSDRIVHIHAHDNNGKEDEHLPIGRGKIDFNRVVSSLKKIGYDRTVTFEVFTSNSDATKSMESFERMWNPRKR
ncbi:MAG: sugar phosphate isomerase/epimerase [Candidatus Micrarchaeota archaeon]|nr:sugar phosphate isomerase/epimerase [Candidatus Micrarchaeota archaeon]